MFFKHLICQPQIPAKLQNNNSAYKNAKYNVKDMDIRISHNPIKDAKKNKISWHTVSHNKVLPLRNIL